MPNRRPPSVIEPLEGRRLLHGVVDLSFNFAPKRVPGVSGMIADVGLAYGDRGDGMTYGWNSDNSKNARDRNAIADQGLDTVAFLQVNGARKKWSIALPDGDYDVTVAAGDAKYVDSVNVINVEGLNVVKTTPSTAHPFNIKTRTVTVTDGKLTLRPGADAVNAKLNWIRIQSVHDDGGEEEPPVDVTPVVGLEAIDDTATEGDSDTGLFRLTRTGDAAGALTVNLDWTGSAGSADLSSPRPSSVTFNAGETVIDLPVVASVDDLDEPTEAAWVTVLSGSGYTLGSTVTGAVLVYNVAPTPPPDPEPGPVSNITWTTTTSSLVAHTEAQSAVVGNALYRFGGYYGNYSATRRVEKFDLTTKTWTRMNDMPRGISHAGTAIVDGKVWLAGGYLERVGSPGQQDIGATDVYIYDPTNDSWSTGPALPAKRGSGGLANVNGVLYFISGEDNPARNDTTTVWAYDTANPGAGWVTKAPIPEGRSHFGTVVLDGKIYCFGGQTNHDANSVMLKTTYVYDPATNAWTRKADMPTPMSHLAPASVAYRGKIYSFGGDYPVYVASNQSREYDPATDTWRLLSSTLPVKRAALVAGVIGDTFVISGGKDQAEWTTNTFLGTVVL